MKRNRPSASFLTRLGRDQRGNTIAIVAAAIVPLLGMIGGGIDMSRLYLAKTRLQQACDAGALAGRRAMGSGSWSTGGTTTPQARANELFKANFATGAYGTTLVGREFTEDDGTVNGTATVSVPMSIMRIFGMTTRTMTVECTAKMEIPNTDVMFVLDVTGSMNCATTGNCPDGNNGNVPMTNAKIRGLKSAVKCFYEALLRVNTSEVCGNDPTATSYAGTAQIRIGFMPYSVNVNVGKLLDNSWLANNWSYQSREAITKTEYGWTVGSESARSNWSAWSAAPTNLNDASAYSNWKNLSSDKGSETINGTDYARSVSKQNSTSCPKLNKNGSILVYTDSPNVQSETVTGITKNPPVRVSDSNKDTQQTLTYGQDDIRTVVGYKYNWNNSKCLLQISDARNYTRSRTSTSTRPIIWTPYPGTFESWKYAPRSFDISSLKTGGSTWANSVALPLATSAGPTIKTTGSSSETIISYVTNTNAPWSGCVEERQTVQNSDGDPSDEWSSIPSAAYDLNIDMIPSSSVSGSYWAPMLPDAVWGRYTTTVNRWGNTVSTNSYDPVYTPDDLYHNMDYYCSTEAKKLQPWITPAGFENYVNSLSAIGNTYHDIGLIWGARFISPTGLFASENAETSTGGAIQRHIIFMTDGDTMTSNTNYSSQGIHWWDRRQTTYAPNGTQLNNILNQRLSALCEAIKGRNITLWVVSYGGGINTDTETRLENCATPGKYFSATDTPTLISNFKQIASEIADLRLTS